jgi:hypothetical protein
MQEEIQHGFKDQLLYPIKKIMGSNEDEENLLEEETEPEKSIVSIFKDQKTGSCKNHHHEVGGIHDH